MELKSIPLTDGISLIIGLLGFVAAYVSSKNRLPSWAQKWLKQIGSERVLGAITKAAQIVELTPDQRRKQAVVYLQQISIAELGFPIPSSIANLLVEFVYQQYKRVIERGKGSGEEQKTGSEQSKTPAS